MDNVDNWNDVARLKHEQFQSCLKDKKWVIDKDSSDLLRDQITFSLFAETKYIYTEEENETIEAIAKKVTSEDVHVSLLFKYVKKEKKKTETEKKEDKEQEVEEGALVPIIKFIKPSDPILYFIDYTNNSIYTWVELQSSYRKDGYAFCLPVDGDYKKDCIIFPGGYSVEKYPNFDLDIKCKNDQEYTVEELKKLFKKVDGVQAAETARQIVQVLFFNCTIKSEFVSDLINNHLTPKEKHDVFVALLKGFEEVSGKVRETLGRANFIKDFVPLAVHSESFSKIKVTSGSLLELPNGLKLDAKAFVQLTEKERMLLFEPVKNDLTNHSDYTDIISEYSFILDFQLQETLDKICRGLNVDALDQFEINGLLICKDLKPFEIKRLQKVLQNACKECKGEYIKLGVELAKKIYIQNFNQFCAVLEYAAISLNEKRDSIVQADKDKRRVQKAHNVRKISTDDATCAAYHDLLKNIDDLCNQFKTLVLMSEEFSRNRTIKFGDPMLAAYHFKKHSKENKKIQLTLETYMKIAHDILSRKDLKSKWVQDGSVRCYYIYDTEHGASAVRYENSIATLMFKNIFKKS